jgi:hypothetical protein
VFFNSPDSLVATDSNGEVDAYMWEDGEVSLLSTGQSSRESRFFNASASGDDAFILTGEALVPQDTDDLVDLYDVRVGGGFPAPEPKPDCAGEDCQGSSSGAPGDNLPGSSDWHGNGNLGEPGRLTLSVRRPSRAQVAKLASGRRIGVRVRVTRAAKIRLVVRGKIGKVRSVIARGSKTARRRGTVIVGLRLTPRARRHLRQDRGMRVSLSVRAAGARSTTLSLQLKGTR